MWDALIHKSQENMTVKGKQTDFMLFCRILASFSYEFRLVPQRSHGLNFNYILQVLEMPGKIPPI